MALDEAPPFWWKKPSWQAVFLSPAAFIYGKISAKRMDLQSPGSVPVPVICVGNFIAGGAGKTPTVHMLVEFLIKQGMKPGVLSRGHGGAITVPSLVKPRKHNAHDVGDEALLHAKLVPTVVAADRYAGAKLLLDKKCDIIVMDDGFQNPSLHKDYNLIVVDSKRALGNGFTIPAGPMRGTFRHQIMKTDSVMVIGDHDNATSVVRKIARAAKPVFHANVIASNPEDFADKDVIAFAGIADPTKLFDTLKKCGSNLVHQQGFGDHHFYTEEECVDLINLAREKKIQLVTTTKDLARLKGMGTAQDKLVEMTIPVKISLQPEDPAKLDQILAETMDQFSKRRLAEKKNKS